VGDFSGRTREAKLLVQAMSTARDGSAPITIVRGMGGIGKTELAYVVANQLLELFPDAQLLIELRGASREGQSPVLALQQVIRAFEPESVLSEDIAELTARYRSLLSERRVLIFADDAGSVEQVRPLLPPPGSCLLITSRLRLMLPGAFVMDLGVLPPASAEQLLVDICSDISELAPKLAQRCGFLPLALRVIASIMASLPAYRIEGYLKRLDDERYRLHAMKHPEDASLDVEAVLLLSFEALDPLAKVALAQLTVFAGSFDHAAAHAVLIQPSDERPLDETLDVIYRRNLLDWDKTTRRHVLHDLVRDFASHYLADAEAVRLRHARYYTQIALQTQALYLNGGTSVSHALVLFDQERSNIDVAWEWASRQPYTSEIDELLMTFSQATIHIGNLRYNKRRERIPQLEQAIAAAQRSSNHLIEGSLLGYLGMAYGDLGESRRAIAIHEQSLSIMRAIGDQRGTARVLGNLGLALTRVGSAMQAVLHHEEQLTVMRMLGDARGEGYALSGLGDAYASLGQLKMAVTYYEQHLAIARRIEHWRGEGSALSSLANAFTRLGDIRQAITYYEQYLVIAYRLGDRHGIAINSWRLGELIEQEGDLVRAISLMEPLVVYYQELQHPEADDTISHLVALRARLRA